MAGALVLQARGALAKLVLPSGRGTEAELTNNVPPSPCELAVTTKAAPSFARKASCPSERPRNWPRFSGTGEEPVAFVVAELFVNPFDSERRPEPAKRKRAPFVELAGD